MSPTLTVIIMMNNYFHDVATAMLLASGVTTLLLLKGFEGANRDVISYLNSIYLGMKKVARFSLYWVLIGGIPRTLTFRSFEWTTASEHGQTPALILKHIIALLAVSFGVWFWLRANERARSMLGMDV